MERIYLDHAATTTVLPEVIETMMNTCKQVSGNPSSIHREGVLARTIIEESRKYLSETLKTSTSQIFFTSGATESNNLVIQSAASSGEFKQIITSPIEHPSIHNSIQYYCSKQNVQVHYLNPNKNGVIDLNELEDMLKSCGKETMVSLLHSHNELGTILPLKECANLCARYGAKLHADTVQSIGLFDIDVTIDGLHSIAGSAHKFNGPKGIGFLYLKDPTHANPILHGGSQERNMRGGTENIMGISGMIKALELSQADRQKRLDKLFFLHNKLRSGIMSLDIPHEFNTPKENFLPKILNVYFEERKNIEWLILNLDIEGIAVSGGSACSSGSEKPSRINEYIRPNSKGKSIRFSFSHLNTEEEIDRTLMVLSKILKD
ncbi:MAG: cysteine desulfurase [Saprospiraceae bacterium]|nr:cysteine desulfurase [Saprospiraceae bacterium]